VLDTYDEERRGHAGQMVQFATRIGAMYQPRNLLTERLRDVAFRILHLVPGGQEYILQMKYKPMPRYTTGLVLENGADPTLDDVIGRMFMQPVVETVDRHTVKLDDAIGDWFAVIGLHIDPASPLDPDSLAWWRSMRARFVHIVAPRSGPPPGGRDADAVTSRVPQSEHTVILEDVDGAFRDWMLAHPNADIVVLRPDRYVAAVAHRAQWIATTSELRRLLGASPARDGSLDAGLRSQRSPEQEGAR
jgi:3-(3-hydroxy-phenyl)propionate hydroxylase